MWFLSLRILDNFRERGTRTRAGERKEGVHFKVDMSTIFTVVTDERKWRPVAVPVPAHR